MTEIKGLHVELSCVTGFLRSIEALTIRKFKGRLELNSGTRDGISITVSLHFDSEKNK